LSSEERLSSSSDESPSPYAANEAMADGLTAALSSVFGFFETAAGCDKDGASRLPAIRINTHHNTTGKDKWNRENTDIRRLSYQHHRVHRGSHEKRIKVKLVRQSRT